jgi:acetate kinase
MSCTRILTVNEGSSGLKLALYEIATPGQLAPIHKCRIDDIADNTGISPAAAAVRRIDGAPTVGRRGEGRRRSRPAPLG